MPAESIRGQQMGPVAMLEASLVEGREYLNCFSDAEQAEILGTRSVARRRERLAGRLTAKFLFLEEECRRSNDPCAPILLTRARIERFTASQYRSAQVFRSEEICGGLPLVSWADRTGTRGVAITHSGGLACAFLGGSEPIAVDLESATARTPAFYTGNFTTREQAWVDECASTHGMDPQWTYTFLWGVKECLLKTPAFRNLSIADMPSLEVRVTSGCERLAYPCSAREFLTRFEFLKADVADRTREVKISLAVSGRHNLVLTAMTAVQRRTV